MKLLLAAFIEGAIVIVIELLGAKMISSYYGNSLKIWTAIITVTITFLTIGYILGGFLSRKKELYKILGIIFSTATLFILLMPQTAMTFVLKSMDMELMSGAILTTTFLLGPPILLIGISSPIIIQLLSSNVEESGRSAGNVYAISTIGGILTTLLVGFYILPNFGIYRPLIFFAVILLVTSVFLFPKKMQFLFAGLFVLLLFNSIDKLDKYDLKGERNMSEYLYMSEGMLGQLKVLEDRFPGTDSSYRTLIINGIPQTIIYNDKNSSSYWPYVHKIAAVSSIKKNKKGILFGMGGGSIATELNRYGIQLDIVDIDGRMFEIAKKYFYFKDSISKFYEDDARHFLKTTKNKYDIAIFDLASGEVQPSNVFTLESFRELKKILRQNALILIQYQEKEFNNRTSGSASIINTLKAAGFNVFRNIEKDNISNIIICASNGTIDPNNIDLKDLKGNTVRQKWLSTHLKSPYELCRSELRNGIILTDDRPVLERINEETIKEWRIQINNFYTKKHLQQGKMLFK